jgi:hypothetical protein
LVFKTISIPFIVNHWFQRTGYLLTSIWKIEHLVCQGCVDSMLLVGRQFLFQGWSGSQILLKLWSTTILSSRCAHHLLVIRELCNPKEPVPQVYAIWRSDHGWILYLLDDR